MEDNGQCAIKDDAIVDQATAVTTTATVQAVAIAPAEDDGKRTALTVAVVTKRKRTTWKQKYSKLAAMSSASTSSQSRGRGRPPKKYGIGPGSTSSASSSTSTALSIVAKKKQQAATGGHSNVANGRAAGGRSAYHENQGFVSIGMAGARRASARNTLRQMGEAIKPGKNQLAKALIAKYSNRRSILFKSVRPMKAPSRRATINTVEMVFHEDRCFSVGDIVSVTDSDDEQPYFAQIRGLIIDPYSTRFAVLNWLIPLDTVNDSHTFDAEHFVHGLADEKWYKLEDIDFEQKQPDIDRYRREWTPRRCAEEQLKRELDERIKDLVTIAAAEYTALDDER